MVKNIFKGISIFLVCFIGINIFAWMTGLADLQFYRYFGKQQANVQREIFKENKSYVEGMVSDLAKYKYELTIEKDPIAKRAIVDLIIDKYGNFDITKLEDISLQRFLIDIRNEKYNNIKESE
jgi:N-acetyl-anhydromuramyl-L-alanine amidase AmpD